MSEVIVDDNVWQRINDFRELFADRTQADLAEVDLNLAPTSYCPWVST